VNKHTHLYLGHTHNNNEPTTVWWLTCMTSSPAWIFLQRSAGDCKRRKRNRRPRIIDPSSLIRAEPSSFQYDIWYAVMDPRGVLFLFFLESKNSRFYTTVFNAPGGGMRNYKMLSHPFGGSCDHVEAVVGRLDIHSLKDRRKEGRRRRLMSSGDGVLHFLR